MPEGDEVYLTIAEAIPYVEYVATAVKVVDGIINFGREDETTKAIRLLTERVVELEQAVSELDERLSVLEQRVAQGENRQRLRTLAQHQLAFGELAVDLRNRPSDANGIAAKAMARLRVMFEDEDFWLWSDLRRKPDGAPDSWRSSPPSFKGIGLPTFAFGTMVWALAATVDVGGREAHRRSADGVLQWVATRTDWVPYVTPPQSLAERFRAAINVEIMIGTKYVTPAGYCEYSLIGVNEIDRTRTSISSVSMYVGPSVNTMCTTDARIGASAEAMLEDDSPYLQILAGLEDAATRIKAHGTLVDSFIGQFPEWTAHRLALYGIEASGQMRRYQIDTTTLLDEQPTVTQIGDVVGTGWQNFQDVHGTFDVVMYAFSNNGAVDWYREDDPARGPAGWRGPRRVRPARQRLQIGEVQRPVNGGGGTFYVVRSRFDRLPATRSLELTVHPDPAGGTGIFQSSHTIVADWPNYQTVFGGGYGIIYGIDDGGDLYWLRHSSWPRPDKGVEGPTKIGNGWDTFVRVFSFGDGFIAGVYPSGEMLLYHFQQWRWGPRGESPTWHGPIRVPGTQWRGFQNLVPMVSGEPQNIH